MAKILTPAEVEAKLALAEAAHAMVSALCQPRGTEGSREWIMSIPARPDYDPDLVIAAALRGLDEVGRSHLAQGEELARWRRSFEGHVYVTNEKYASLAAAQADLAGTQTMLALANGERERLRDENTRLTLAGSAAASLVAKVMVGHLAVPNEELFSLATKTANALLHAKSPESFGPAKVQP